MSWHEPNLIQSLQDITIESDVTRQKMKDRSSNLYAIGLKIQLAKLFIYLAKKLDPSLKDDFTRRKPFVPTQSS